MTNGRLLKSALAKMGMTTEEFAKALGIGRNTLYAKINGTSEFDQSEIKRAKNILELTTDEMLAIFFA